MFFHINYRGVPVLSVQDRINQITEIEGNTLKTCGTKIIVVYGDPQLDWVFKLNEGVQS